MTSLTASEAISVSTITVAPVDRMSMGVHPCLSCFHTTDAFAAMPSSINPIACTQPAPGVAIQIEPVNGSVNALICTQKPALDAATATAGLAMDVQQPRLLAQGDQIEHALQVHTHFGAGLVGSLVVLVVLATSSTLWYRQKYHHLANAGRNSASTQKRKGSVKG